MAEPHFLESIGGFPAPHATDVAVRQTADVALVVDLDGTLIRTDSLAESVLLLAAEHPLTLLWLPWWLRRGRAALKAEVAERVLPDVHTLPFERELLAYLSAQKRDGRRLVLATGANERIARAVAAELGLFDAVIASNGSENLTGEHKRRRLVREFGERGFDYAGNSSHDLPVWRSARRALLVAPPAGLAAAVAEVTGIERVFDADRRRLGAWLHAMRPHHWLKNLLLFVPLLTAHRLNQPAAVLDAAIGCAGFCCAASATYLLNDLLDLPADRRHPRKRARALASGQIPIAEATLLIGALWLAAIAAGLMLPGRYLVALGIYAALMLAYCLRLKHLALIDAFALALGYMLRIAAGAVAVGVAVSAWLLVCSGFLFFSLALLKRYAELVSLHPGRPDPAARVRAYRVGDAIMIATLGAASGCVAVLVLALYPIVDPSRSFAHGAVWLVCALLLFWITHMWLMAHRGNIHDDPVSFALRDRASQVLGALTLAVLVVAT